MTKNKSKRGHLKQKNFSDHNISPIEAHKRSKKDLLAPFNSIGTTTLLSWRDDHLPQMIWACVVAQGASRNDYLDIFRKIVSVIRGGNPDYKKSSLTHGGLSALPYEVFEEIFRPIKLNSEVFRALGALKSLTSLPDQGHWNAFLEESTPDNPWEILASAVAATLDHQSETSTDIRWLTLIHKIVSGQVVFGPNISGVDELLNYPNMGDMKSVRPRIRAMEIGFRMAIPDKDGKATPEINKSKEFWAECLSETQCIAHVTPWKHEVRSELIDELMNIYDELGTHFHSTSTNTGIDPRKDASFGLPLYTAALIMELAASATGYLSSGRIVLRTITEIFITLHFLKYKDSETVWKQYRNYGNGQAKLSFLKLVRESEVPSFVSMEELHQLANEDVWMEFQDINLGSWEGTNLRSMAEQAGCKDVYDKYYSWNSGFTHGQWVAVRDAVFTTCWNPLHRLHRIPAPERQMPSVLSDCCKLFNRMLDDLNSLYPTFKSRIGWHKKFDTESTDTSD